MHIKGTLKHCYARDLLESICGSSGKVRNHTSKLYMKICEETCCFIPWLVLSCESSGRVYNLCWDHQGEWRYVITPLSCVHFLNWLSPHLLEELPHHVRICGNLVCQVNMF
jgi:hypothetical protein